MNYWKSNPRKALYASQINANQQLLGKCGLCPRSCLIPEGKFGFCGVRGTVDGSLHTFNYGRSIGATEEIIETEAVFHYAPGARILSLGNIGCMMDCDFCQNWETSQVQYLPDHAVCIYSPNDIIKICRDNNIGIISWTYNDPVVWQEFVVETSQIARENNIHTLYKSALYIQESPLEDLLNCIDIFSISLKSLDPEFYKQHTGAQLEPILERIKSIASSDKHLELSQLLVTGLNDSMQDIEQTIHWVLDTLGEKVPLHFVGFHPAYRYMEAERTPGNILLKAQSAAKRLGIQHCYQGNVYKTGVNDTKCTKCEALLVARYGLHADVNGINHANKCIQCGANTDIKHPFLANNYPHANSFSQKQQKVHFSWNTDINNVHIVLEKPDSSPARATSLRIIHKGSNYTQELSLGKGLGRIIISRYSPHDTGIEVSWEGSRSIKILPVFDRAHYPLPDEEIDLSKY